MRGPAIRATYLASGDPADEPFKRFAETILCAPGVCWADRLHWSSQTSLKGAPLFQTIPGRPTPAGESIMTYAQKLKDPRWKARRLEILKAANYKCAHCHTSERLEVHHINYRKGKEPWAYLDCELMCLCRKCHELVEAVAIPDLRCLVAILPAWTLFHMCIAVERTVIAMKDRGKSLSVASILEEAAFRQRMEDTVRHVMELQSKGNQSDYLAMAEEIMEGQR